MVEQDEKEGKTLDTEIRDSYAVKRAKWEQCVSLARASDAELNERRAEWEGLGIQREKMKNALVSTASRQKQCEMLAILAHNEYQIAVSQIRGLGFDPDEVYEDWLTDPARNETETKAETKTKAEAETKTETKAPQEEEGDEVNASTGHSEVV